jgi:uncharacterized caspase-like protein
VTGACLYNAASKADKSAQSNSAQPTPLDHKNPIFQIARKFAVVIGINQYQDKRIPQLLGAVPDMHSIADVLEHQLGYQVKVLQESTKQDLFSALNQLAADARENDSVLVYYAGHGTVIDRTGFGYWIPSDARADRPETWVSNGDLNRLLARLESKQIAVIADSCYSGRFAQESGLSESANASMDQLLERRAVTMMSSGGDEPVADTGKEGHSVFAWGLLDTLQKLPSWARGSRVYESVRGVVLEELPQRPRYGASVSAGHQAGGDYLFERRAAPTAQ